MHDEYLEEMRKLQEQLKDREATLKQEESFVRQLDADNEEQEAGGTGGLEQERRTS